MLYHVPDRARAIAELARVLAPGGWLAAATNGTAHLDELEQLLRDLELPGATATAVEPLLAYVRSLTRVDLDRAAEDRIRAAVSRAIERDGAFAIRKDAGLFLARGFR